MLSDMRKREPYIEFLQEQFSTLGAVVARETMFGGYCLYCDSPYSRLWQAERCI